MLAKSTHESAEQRFAEVFGVGRGHREEDESTWEIDDTTRESLGDAIQRKSEEILTWPAWAQPFISSEDKRYSRSRDLE